MHTIDKKLAKPTVSVHGATMQISIMSFPITRVMGSISVQPGNKFFCSIKIGTHWAIGGAVFLISIASCPSPLPHRFVLGWKPVIITGGNYFLSISRFCVLICFFAISSFHEDKRYDNGGEGGEIASPLFAREKKFTNSLSISLFPL